MRVNERLLRVLLGARRPGEPVVGPGQVGIGAPRELEALDALAAFEPAGEVERRRVAGLGLDPRALALERLRPAQLLALEVVEQAPRRDPARLEHERVLELRACLGQGTLAARKARAAAQLLRPLERRAGFRPDRDEAQARGDEAGSARSRGARRQERGRQPGQARAPRSAVLDSVPHRPPG